MQQSIDIIASQRTVAALTGDFATSLLSSSFLAIFYQEAGKASEILTRSSEDPLRKGGES
jgi:hypothetical protein